MTWNVRTRATALCWARRATTMKYLHFITSQYYQRVSQFLTGPSAFLMAGVGTGVVGIAAAEQGTLVSQIFLWILAGLSFLAAGIAGINWELDPSQLSEKHLYKSVCWGDVVDDLIVELSFADEDQQDEKRFLPQIQKKMSLTENQPPILPTWVFDLQVTNVMKGEMAKDLLDLEKRFGTVMGIFKTDIDSETIELDVDDSQSPQDAEPNNPESGRPNNPESAEPNNPESGRPNNPESDRPNNPESAESNDSVTIILQDPAEYVESSSRQHQDSDHIEMSNNIIETQDYLCKKDVKLEIARQQRSIRQDLKRKRAEYQLNRLFGQQQFNMDPPTFDEFDD